MYRDRLKDGAQVSIIDTHMHVSFDRPVNKPVICEFAESMNHCFSGERSWFESLRVASILTLSLLSFFCLIYLDVHLVPSLLGWFGGL
jgi:hypothetical protein